MSLLIVFGYLLCLLICISVIYVRQVYSYFERKGFSYEKPSFPLGNVNNVGCTDHLIFRGQKVYNQFKNEQCAGMFFTFRPIILAISPEFIQNILIKDFTVFHNRGAYVNERDDPMSAHLFALEGQKWKNMRNKLRPTFTSGKLKQMFDTIAETSDKLVNVIMKRVNSLEGINLKDFCTRYTADVIGLCAFGVECNALNDQKSEIMELDELLNRLTIRSWMRIIFFINFPRLAQFFKVRAIPVQASSFLFQILTDVVEYRESNNVQKKDFLNTLMNIKNSGRTDVTDDEHLGTITFNELAAQSFLFFFVGYETTATALFFVFYELAYNTEIQDKVRKEIMNVVERKNGKLDYESISEMTYMDKVLDETLRKYPPSGVILRVANQHYQIPGTKQIIEKGTMVTIPLYALHRDPRYYPNPDTFDPERFSSENLKSRPPCTYLPFGDGPRNCIGMRFGQIQIKIAIAKVLSKFQISLKDNSKYPLQIDFSNASISPRTTIMFNVRSLNFKE